MLFRAPGRHHAKPGVYKGDKDELLAKSQQQQQTLIDRFKLVQTDR